MKKRRATLIVLGMTLVAALVLAVLPRREEPVGPAGAGGDAAPAHEHPPAAPAGSAAPEPHVPPYRTPEEIRRGPLPRVMDAAHFRGYPAVERAYRIAARIPEVLAEQPCYCWCDRFGHGSLLDCFADDHGAG